MRVDRGARSAPSGRGRAGGGPGEPGKPGLWGVSRVPLALAGFLVRQARRCIGGRCCALPPVMNSPGAVVFAPSPVIGAARTVVLRDFPGHWCGRNCRLFGEAGVGVWGRTWNRAVVLRGRGGFGFSPSAFPDWSSLLSVYSWSRAVVFLTSPSCLVEGVRSGTRRRRGASASAQAGGETGPETQRTAPERAGAALYGRCARSVRGLSGEREEPS